MKYWKDCTTEEKIERWVQCRRVLFNLPQHERDKHFDMWNWGIETECGTIACAAGHCGMDPWFIERGFKLVPARDAVLAGAGSFSINQENWQGGIAVPAFFGGIGTASIFFRAKKRTVDNIIAEVDAHIYDLRGGKYLD